MSPARSGRRKAIAWSATMLAFPTLSAMAQLPTSLTISTNNTPLDRKALAQLAEEACKRIGVGFKLVSLPSERSLVAANQGEVDGEGLRVAGLEENYPNLVRVPERFIGISFVAFAANPAITLTEGWASLKPHRVAFINGWKMFEANATARVVHKLDKAEQLFQMLAAGRIDLALYTLADGVALVRQLGCPASRRWRPRCGRGHVPLPAPEASTPGAPSGQGAARDEGRRQPSAHPGRHRSRLSPGTVPSRATLLRLGLASRVSRRILAWALAVGAVGTLAVSWWDAERAYEEQTARLGTTLQGLAEFAAPSLAGGAWTFDRAQIDTQLDAFTRMADVSAVTLAITGQPPIQLAPHPVSSQVLERKAPLVHMDDGRAHTLGTLTLTHDLQRVQAQRRAQWLHALATNGLVILLTALSSVLIYQFIVTRRLLAIASQLRGVTAQDLRALPATPAAAGAGRQRRTGRPGGFHRHAAGHGPPGAAGR
jgi:polar amino acid transport system substrate-binding protein